jgi:serine/threonine-protein kinase
MEAQAGKYRDIAELGRGGMGDVYLTVASGPAGFNKLLVVKRLRHSLASDPEFLQMFLNEARTAARLNHANIVQTYEVGFDGDRYFIAMEYLQGQSMSQLIRSASHRGGLPLAMQCRVLADALAGLHYAHEQRDYDGTDLQIVHRDVSPPNIFVLYDGQVKIVDFGIAKTAYSGETKAGIFKGKIQYVAPEQYTGAPVDRRTDIYSAGVILWEAATRRRMWKGLGDLTIMQRVAAGDVPLPSSIEPKIPKRLEAICMRALALRPDDRYPTAVMFQSELEEFLEELGGRIQARDVGNFTAETFADTRARMNFIVEEQLRVLRENPDPLSLVPIVASQQPTLTGMLSARGELRPPAGARGPHWGLTLSVVAVLSVLTIGLVVARWVRGPAGPGEVQVVVGRPSPNAVAETMAAPAPALPFVADQVRLSVEPFPMFASVGIDDALLPAGVREIVMRRDHAAHRVWAEAPGYRSKAEWVRFDAEEIALKLVLNPSQAGRPARRESSRDAARRSSAGQPTAVVVEPGPAAPAEQAPSVPLIRELDPLPVRRPDRPSIDTGDPWK